MDKNGKRREFTPQASAGIEEDEAAVSISPDGAINVAARTAPVV